MVFDFDDECDCTGDCASVDESNFSVDERDASKYRTENDRVHYKCPDFPYCKVVTPFCIRLSTPEDMEHYMKYHDM